MNELQVFVFYELPLVLAAHPKIEGSPGDECRRVRHLWKIEIRLRVKFRHSSVPGRVRRSLLASPRDDLVALSIEDPDPFVDHAIPRRITRGLLAQVES